MAVQSELISNNESLRRQCNQLKRRNQDLEASREKQDRQLDESLASVSQLTADLQAAESDRDRIAQRFAKLKGQHAATKQTIQSLSNDAADAHRFSASLSTVRADHEATELQLRTLQNDYQRTLASLREQQRMYSTQSSELRRLQDEHMAMQTMVDRAKVLDEQLEQLRRENAMFKSHASENRDQSQVLLDKLHSYERELRTREANQARLQQLEALNEELSAKNTELGIAVKERTRELRIQKRLNEEYAQQMAEMKSAFTANTAELEAIQSHFSAKQPLSRHVEELMHRSQEERRKVAEARRQISELQDKLEENALRLADREKSISELTVQVRESALFREELDSQRFALDESTRARERLAAKIAKKKVQLQLARTETERLKSETEDLGRRKIELQNLQQEHNQTIRELRQTKQRLAKTESELQAVSTITQRQQSEQIKEMSKDLREMQTRISRVVTQTSRAFPVESLEDIPRTMADVKQKMARATATLSRLTSVLDMKTDDELTTEVRNMKQQAVQSQEFLREMSIVLNVDSFKKCSRAISELRSQLDEAKSRERQLCELLEVESCSKALSAVSRISETNRLVKRVGHVLKAETQTEVLEKLGKLVEIEELVTPYVKAANLRSVSQWLTLFDEMQRREAQIMEVLDLSSPQEIEAKIDLLVQDHNELASLNSALKLHQSLTRVSELTQIEAVCRDLLDRLDLQDCNELPETITDLLRSNAAMNELEGQIMVSLSVVSPEAILGKINELNTRLEKQAEQLQSIAAAVRTKDINLINQRIAGFVQLRKDVKQVLATLGTQNLVDGIQSLVDQRKEVIDFIDQIIAQLRVTHQDEILPAIAQIMQDRDTILSLNRKFPSRYKHDTFEENFDQLLNELRRALRFGQLLDCEGLDNIEAAIQRQQNDLASASILFSKLLSGISTSDITLSFPVDDACYSRLNKLIDEAKAQFDNERLQMELLMNRANSFGYRGADLGEALDAIVSACCEADKDKIHEDLMIVRGANEKQKMKAQKVIDELNEKLMEEKQRRVEVEKMCLNEQRVRQELMLLACGHACDREFLEQHLDQTDIQVFEQRRWRKTSDRSGSQ
jgi:hypothetical protein